MIIRGREWPIKEISSEMYKLEKSLAATFSGLFYCNILLPSLNLIKNPELFRLFSWNFLFLHKLLT